MYNSQMSHKQHNYTYNLIHFMSIRNEIHYFLNEFFFFYIATICRWISSSKVHLSCSLLLIFFFPLIDDGDCTCCLVKEIVIYEEQSLQGQSGDLSMFKNRNGKNRGGKKLRREIGVYSKMLKQQQSVQMQMSQIFVEKQN